MIAVDSRATLCPPISAASERTNQTITSASPPEQKIKLFRSLFRGREDVYPRRFESRKTGKAGYVPACANEWVRGICEKPRIKCLDCPHRRLLPVTDEVIRRHLSGGNISESEFVAGVYPLLQDETCHFLAVDLDGEDWRKDAAAFLDSCRRLAIAPALERSRSGNGAHIWFFFSEPVPAGRARDLGSLLLTQTMERRPEIGFHSYDRLFPNQDTLPRGGFGNLIALPLQAQARRRGHTVFLDDAFQPYPDQWAFLSSLSKLSRARLESLVGETGARRHILGVRMPALEEDDPSPWQAPPSRRRPEPPIAGPLPENLELVLADQIYIAKEGLEPRLRNRLLRLAAFQNPEFYRAQAMRLPTYDKPRIVVCAEDLPHHLGLPRGCLEEVCQTLHDLEIKPIIRDERQVGTAFRASFQGILRPEQKKAGEAMLRHDTGVLAATTAFGKTVVAAWLIARQGVNTLVLVHRRQLLDQWIERLSHFLAVPPKQIGRVGGGRRKLTGMLDVALIQSLVRHGVVDDRVGDYGHLVVDECHHLSARSFELVARRAKAKYVSGLSATVTRKDGHHPVIFMQCGPIRYKVDARQQAAQRPFAHEVLVRPTTFWAASSPEEDPRGSFQHICDAVWRDPTRNGLICGDIKAAVRQGRTPLVITERTEHLDILAQALAPHIPHLITLKGGMRRKDSAAARARLAETANDGARVILATGRYIGEGFDDPRLDTLFLTMPVSWRGTVAQYVGRLHRLYEGKREVRVYDYADTETPMLARMFDRRCRGYEALGYTILLPTSVLPGWPAEVPLPIDPMWKRDYAASVRRLIRDGVNVSLATSFAHASAPAFQETQSELNARSAYEAFLYRRLETLPETAGYFRLNAELPIPFNCEGSMEVDLLSADAKLVIELDGAQHLANAEAYRRDRKKDALLQEHGYFVLRFLAEDTCKRLDCILDTILAVLVHRRNRAQRDALGSHLNS